MNLSFARLFFFFFLRFEEGSRRGEIKFVLLMFIIGFVSITSYFRGSHAKIFALPCISLPLSLPGVPANQSSQGRRACFSFCT